MSIVNIMMESDSKQSVHLFQHPLSQKVRETYQFFFQRLVNGLSFRSLQDLYQRESDKQHPILL